MECVGPATVVFDSSLTAYDFGPSHPMSPIRVDLTMRLARDLGVLDRLRDGAGAVRRRRADRDGPRRGADRRGHPRRARTRSSIEVDDHGLATDDNPVFADMHRAAAHVVGASLEAFRQVHSGESLHSANIAGGLHHAMRDRVERLLHLQRRRGGHPVAARPGRREGRLRRRRRPPRRRRRGDLLRRPAGADDLAARVRADAVPRHRLPERLRRPAGPGHRGQRRAPARHRRRRLAAGVPRGRPSRWSARSRRRCW